MLPSLLIANRGEIACRVIRTARRLGLRTIAVYSSADAKAPHVRLADAAYEIGPAPARDSYLRGDVILDVAKRAGAAAIHPGYGFLSENVAFAEACAAAGVVFVGPPASAISAMGLKDAAKALVEKAGVPVVPGYHGENQDPAFLKAQAEAIGYPVLIKAVAGGGGKGMRRVDEAGQFLTALESAQREAQNAFGDPRVLVEKYITAPRHVEIQVFADTHGNVVHLFERDCSLQRRHQKVIEEAPAPGMPPSVREAMGRAAVEAARAVGYVGAGTVEFIADGSKGLSADGFYFMEMNTRLQVEHPVTEAITGLDLVELQLRVASGEALPFAQADLAMKGHAVEARVYAEDPDGGFLPSTGKLWALSLPEGEGIRVDAGVEQGGEVTPFYDPMIAKVIAHGATREEALDRLSQALSRTMVAGPRSNVAFLKALADAPGFRQGLFDTGFIERNLQSLGIGERVFDAQAAALGGLELAIDLHLANQPAGGAPDPWGKLAGFGLQPRSARGLSLVVDGERHEAILDWTGNRPSVALDGACVGLPDEHYRKGDALWPFGAGDCFVRDDLGLTIVGTGSSALVLRAGRQIEVGLFDPFSIDLDEADGDAVVKSPMHGKLIARFVEKGDRVVKGQRLAIVEAMKMEHVLTAPRDGEVIEADGTPGMQVAQGARLIVVH